MGLSRSAATTIRNLVPADFNDERDAINWIKLNVKVIEKSISKVYYKEILEIV